MELALQQISSHLGIEVLGMNLTEEIGSKMLGMLFDQLRYHHLLIIREQHLTEEQLIRVGSYFGEPIPALVPTHRLEKYPVISKHANRQDENQLPIGAIAPEYVFHGVCWVIIGFAMIITKLLNFKKNMLLIVVFMMVGGINKEM